MGYYDRIASRMLLNTLLYAISELSKVNNRIKTMIKDQKMVIKISIGGGGPTEYLEIKNDMIHFERDKVLPTHDTEINFNRPKEFIKLLKNLKIDLDQLEADGKIALKGPDIFKKNCEEIINIALPYYNDAVGGDISREEEMLQVKIILFALMAGFQEITEEDENVRAEIRDISIIIKVEVVDGPHCYLLFQKGTFKGYMEVQNIKPTVTIRISDLETARALLTGKGDAAKALIQGKIQIEGETKHAMKLININELIADYTDYIKMKQKR